MKILKAITTNPGVCCQRLVVQALGKSLLQSSARLYENKVSILGDFYIFFDEKKHLIRHIRLQILIL